jgi:DNA-binding transcriptional LysR family regulator
MRRRSKLPRVEEKPSPAVADGDAILQVKIWLAGVSPMIWRRVLVPTTFTLRELHGVIQVAMGWEGIRRCNSRRSDAGLSVFVIDGAHLSLPARGDVVVSDGEMSRRLALAGQGVTRLSRIHIRPEPSLPPTRSTASEPLCGQGQTTRIVWRRYRLLLLGFDRPRR